MTTQPLEEVTTKTERRHFQRRKFRGSMEIEWGAAVLKGTVRDIGPRGLFVELTPPLWVGAAFRARLILNPVLLLDCTVVRVEPRWALPSFLKLQKIVARRSSNRSW